MITTLSVKFRSLGMSWTHFTVKERWVHEKFHLFSWGHSNNLNSKDLNLWHESSLILLDFPWHSRVGFKYPILAVCAKLSLHSTPHSMSVIFFRHPCHSLLIILSHPYLSLSVWFCSTPLYCFKNCINVPFGYICLLISSLNSILFYVTF